MSTGLKELKPGKRQWVDRGIFAYRGVTGIRYGISFIDQSGKRRQKVVSKTLTRARAALEEHRTSVRRNEYRHAPRHRVPTFAAYADRYLEGIEKRSVDRDALALRHAVKVFGQKPIDDVTVDDVKTFKRRRRAQGCEWSTVNRDLAVLKHVFTCAVDSEIIRRNPARFVKMTRVQEKARRVLSADEERRLLEASAPHFRDLATVAIHTGMRRGELLALRWEDIDFDPGVIEVCRETKSYKNRTIPMNPLVRKTLWELHQARTDRGDSEHVFTFDGSPIESVKTALRGALRRSGIRPCRLHDFRHTFGSRLGRAGKNPKAIQKLMGHSSLRTTMNYVHTDDDEMADAVNATLEASPRLKVVGENA